MHVCVYAYDSFIKFAPLFQVTTENTQNERSKQKQKLSSARVEAVLDAERRGESEW